MTKSHLFIHQHNLLRRRLLLLGQILVFNLGHKPNIRVDNELLGPRTLQIIYKNNLINNRHITYIIIYKKIASKLCQKIIIHRINFINFYSIILMCYSHLRKKKTLLFTINPLLFILLKFSYIKIFFLMNYWAPNFKPQKNDDILTQKRDVI